ncbi:MAG: hypothetical protein WC443_10590 [Desulfobaccales bacterium]
MLPRLGAKYAIDVETVTRSREEYQSDAYKALGLPAAPAVLVEDELAGQGPGLSEEKLEAVIRRHLGLLA